MPFFCTIFGESIILHENAEYIICFIGEIVYNQNNLRRYCYFHTRRLGYVRAVYEPAMGTIRSAWEYLDDDRVLINVMIPFDTECILRVRAGGERFRMEALDMTEMGGREKAGASFTEPDENGILLYAGTYEFIFLMPSGTDKSRTL